MIELDALEQDALTEIFNIGVGVAAEALYQLGGEHVPLSVPVVELTSQAQAQTHYLDKETQPLLGIRQTYRGEFTTDALLMFRQENGLELARLLAGPDVAGEELADMVHDALGEIGNIILNAVISNLSSTLKLPLEGSLPEVCEIDPRAIFPSSGTDPIAGIASVPVLALMVDFELHTRHVHGYLAFLLDTPSSQTLLRHLGNYARGG